MLDRNKALDYLLKCLKSRLVVLLMNSLFQVVNRTIKKLRTTLFPQHKCINLFFYIEKNIEKKNQEKGLFCTSMFFKVFLKEREYQRDFYDYIVAIFGQF